MTRCIRCDARSEEKQLADLNALTMPLMDTEVAALQAALDEARGLVLVPAGLSIVYGPDGRPYAKRDPIADGWPMNPNHPMHKFMRRAYRLGLLVLGLGVMFLVVVNVGRALGFQWGIIQ